MGITLRADMKWSMSVCVPEPMQHGLGRAGLVQGQDYFTRTVAVAPFKVGMFSKPEQALGWLEKGLEPFEQAGPCSDGLRYASYFCLPCRSQKKPSTQPYRASSNPI